jgi:trehalose-phosphatase
LGATAQIDRLLEPLRSRPAASAIVCDIDGTLAPIVPRPEDAAVPAPAQEVLRLLADRYALVACLSGRRAADAQRVVGLTELVYVGNHGLEVLEPGASGPRTDARARASAERVGSFARGAFDKDLEGLGVRLEDKDAIWAYHYRGAPDAEAARAALEQVALRAVAAGLRPHWGRMVLEVRPPVPADKGTAIAWLLDRVRVSGALFGGDDVTDLDAFHALRDLRSARRLTHAVCAAVRSAEGPAAIVDEADVVVEGTDGFADLLRQLAV